METGGFTLLLCAVLIVIGGAAGAFVGLILFALRGAARGTGAGTPPAAPTWTDDDEIAARHHH